MTGEYVHHPVMLAEVIEALTVVPSGCYVDATFGRGGHASALLEHLGPEGRLIVMDKDPLAIEAAQALLGQDSRVTIIQGSSAQLADEIDQLGLSGRIGGILLDLGVSSPQLDDPSRGFSFRKDGPLDMRMDPEQGSSAAQWIAHASEREIAMVLKEYGEERYARRIARAIVAGRQVHPITTTAQLAAIVAEANPAWEHGKNPATRSFQAIRIFINHELDDLTHCLNQTLRVLEPGGRLVVISFHSLEDRIVKRFMRRQAQGEQLPRGVPVMEKERNRTLRIIGKPGYPGDVELAHNLRARSAVLRVAERLQ